MDFPPENQVIVSSHLFSIDGIDISTIGLEDLRSRLVSDFVQCDTCCSTETQTIVSQDVALFEGSKYAF